MGDHVTPHDAATTQDLDLDEIARAADRTNLTESAGFFSLWAPLRRLFHVPEGGEAAAEEAAAGEAAPGNGAASDAAPAIEQASKTPALER